MNDKNKRTKLDSSIKKFDVSTTKKPWSIISNGKPLSRNTIYIGEILPDFLMQNYQREHHSITRPDGSVVDNIIRQKVKKTIIKELIRLNYKINPHKHQVRDVKSVVANVHVKIKHISNKGWAVIIDKRRSIDVDKDTLKVRSYLEKKGIEIKDENICPMYCIPTKKDKIKDEI